MSEYIQHSYWCVVDAITAMYNCGDIDANLYLHLIENIKRTFYQLYVEEKDLEMYLHGTRDHPIDVDEEK